MATAILPFQKFCELYRRWVRTVYANKPGDDGFTPKQRWLKYYAKHSPALRYSNEQLAMFRLRATDLTFRDSGGLMRLRLRYDCDELQALRKHIGAKATVVVYTGPDDLTCLYVLDPLTHVLIRVPTTEDLNYVATVNERQHRLVLAMQRTRKNTNPAMKDLYEARLELAKLVEQARESHKLLERRWARRAMFDGATDGTDVKPTAATNPSGTSELILVTELEDEIIQLQEVDLSEIDAW